MTKNQAKDQGNRVKDKSGDRQYWVQTPMIVWALCEDPYEVALWFTIKSVAGEDWECTLSTDDLATLSMMSVGKVSQCRSRLIKIGLLEGEIRKDPDYPQPVWHLTIPDIWRPNLEWAEKHHTMRSKVTFKRLQRTNKKKSRSRGESLHHMKPEGEEPSPHEGGTPPHEGGTPPHEGGTPPHEGGTPPHETNKIYIDQIDPNQDPILDPRDPTTTTIDLQWRGWWWWWWHFLPSQQSSKHTEHQRPPRSVCASPVRADLLAMRTLALGLIADNLPTWNHPERHVDACNEVDLRNLLSWLWLLERIRQAATASPYSIDAYYDQQGVDAYRAALQGIRDPIAYLVSRTGGGPNPQHLPANLTDADAAALDAAIRSCTVEMETLP